MKKFYSLIGAFIAFMAMSAFIVGTAHTTSAQGITFEPVEDSPLINVGMGTSLFVDLNNDGHPDIFLMGILNPETFEMDALVYLNDGLGNFTELENDEIPGLFLSAAAFGDVNGDGYPDLMISGSNRDFEQKTLLFINDGEGYFTPSSSQFMGLVYSSIAMGDVNGDGHTDILISGMNFNTQSPNTLLYLNNGDGTFTTHPNIPFLPVFYGKVELIDLNGDGHLDVFSSGTYEDADYNMFCSTNIYFNDGAGNFTLSGNSLQGFAMGGADFADLNGDGHTDIFIIGGDSETDQNVAKLYFNDGNGNFTASAEEFVGLIYSDVAIADVNGDGYPDILVGGGFSDNSHGITLYLNNGDATFTIVEGLNLSSGDGMKLSFADIDGNGTPDLLMTRLVDEYPFTNLYRNTTELVSVETIKQTDFYAYPNPSNGLFKLFGSLSNSNQQFEVYNLMGQKVYSKTHNESAIELDLTDYPNGVYMVRMGLQTIKLIKQ